MGICRSPLDMDQVSGNFLCIAPFGGAWLTQVTLGAVSDDPFVGNAPHGVLFFFFPRVLTGISTRHKRDWFGSGFLPLGIAHDLPSLARWGSGVDPGKQLVPSPADAAGGHLNRPGQTARVGIAADRAPSTPSRMPTSAAVRSGGQLAIEEYETSTMPPQ